MKAFLKEWVGIAELPQKDEVKLPPPPSDILPDEIYIPSDCPNDIDSIRACIDAQCVGRGAMQ